jgi:hypothetical protein
MPISDHVATVVAEVRERIAAARARGGHGQDVTLIAVTKTHGPEAVLAAWDAGIRDVGENKVQEAEAKMAQVTVPVRWHLIGHLQRNKAKNAAKFDLVHSLDSERLAVALNDAAGEAQRVLEVLDVRSGTAREALGLEDADVERWILATIEENSGTAFSHIEAEVEEKIDALLEGHAFHEAVTDAVQGSLHGIVEEILDGILADAITDHLGDAEDIVRKGLRSIL